MAAGSRTIEPAQEGQLSGVPARSFAIRCSACAGLYEFGRGFRIPTPVGVRDPRSYERAAGSLRKSNPQNT